MLTIYTRNENFSDDAANNVGGRSTVDCAGLDSELDEVKTVLDEARTYFAQLLRDDLSQIISADAINYIAASLNSTAFVWHGQWLTATDYLVNNMVFEDGASYICVVNHTSGVFATDLAAGKWELLAQQGSATALPSQGGNANKVLITDGSNPSWASPQTLPNSNTPAGDIVATTIQAAINELDTEKGGLAKHNTWTKAQGLAQVALTDAANIATDASLSNVFSVTLAGNRTLDNPTNLVAGFTYIWNITQDGIGARTLVYGNLFKFTSGIVPTLTTAAGAKDSLSCIYDGTILRCNLSKGFA